VSHYNGRRFETHIVVRKITIVHERPKDPSYWGTVISNSPIHLNEAHRAGKVVPFLARPRGDSWVRLLRNDLRTDIVRKELTRLCGWQIVLPLAILANFALLELLRPSQS
jgi:hypothetical protein